MKLHAYIQCIGLFEIAALEGCSLVKRIHGISVSPKQAEVVVDVSNQGRMKMEFHVPTDELSKIGRLLITPPVW